MGGFAGERRRVVVLGGGFGGAYAAQTLCKRIPSGWDIVLIDRHNFLLFYPLLVEAGVGSIEPRHVVVPIREFMPKAEFRMGEVLSIDTEHQLVRYRVAGTDWNDSLHYDHLVVALGSVTKMPPVPGLQEHGFELKTLSDSIALRDRGIQLMEIASTIHDRELRKALLRVVVVGANFTGVELAGEYQDFLTDVVKRYRNVDREDVSVMLLEYADRILPALDEELAGFAHRHLTDRGLDIRTKTSVTEVRGDGVTLTTGQRVPTYTCVWAAGIAPNPLIAKTPALPTDERGWIECEPDQRVKGFDNVWAVGDLSKMLGADGKPYPATAQNATREGKHLAANLARAIEGLPTRAFSYVPAGSVAALGCRSAVAKLMGIKLAGGPAWFVYRTLYVMKMPSWSRRLRILADWTVDLFFKRDIVQLGLARVHGSDRQVVAPSVPDQSATGPGARLI